MSATHTPGPWRVSPSVEGMLCIFADVNHRQDGYLDACVCAVSAIMDKTEIDEANARLIAAAPELLEALERVVAIADRDTVEFNAAKAAIAKAKGETK